MKDDSSERVECLVCERTFPQTSAPIFSLGGRTVICNDCKPSYQRMRDLELPDFIDFLGPFRWRNLTNFQMAV